MKPDLSLAFERSSASALVIGGVDVSRNSNLSEMVVSFDQYDPKTNRLIPSSDKVLLYEDDEFKDLTIKTVAPGNYILTLIASVPNTFEMKRALMPNPDGSPRSRIDADARVDNVKAYRFHVEAGEAIYLGEFMIGAYKPDWENRAKEMQAQLAKMPNIKVKPVFRPPELRTE